MLTPMRAGILYYVSSTLNPILYSVMSHRYRRALRDTICPSRSDGGRRRGGSAGCLRCCCRDAGNSSGSNRDGHAQYGSSPGFIYELDSRAGPASRVDSRRYDSGSATVRYFTTAAL